VKPQHPKDVHSSFIRVELAIPCDHSTDWITTKSNVRDFSLIRDKECDRKLEQFMDMEDENTHQKTLIPRWKHTDASEDIALPFGQIVPCYRSAQFPPVPVL
jgi:hypothetical protein